MQPANVWPSFARATHSSILFPGCASRSEALEHHQRKKHHFKGWNSVTFTLWTDQTGTVFESDWGKNIIELKSYSGKVEYMNRYHVAWYTHRQAVVAASSAEADYITVRTVCNDGLSLC